jgi:hypothetical protein
MLLGFVLLFAYAFIVWLVFFKFRWLKFTIGWGFFSAFFVVHLMIIILIGLRFVAPLATEARIIQHTIQLIPRLPEPTLVTAVMVQPNVPVKKGQPLFQFDRRPYQYKVNQLEASLAKAKQDVSVMKNDIQLNADKILKLRAELTYAKYQEKLSLDLAKQGAGPEEDAQKRTAQVAAYEAGIKEAQAEETRARLRYDSQINGVNTTVAATQAELDQARCFPAWDSRSSVGALAISSSRRCSSIPGSPRPPSACRFRSTKGARCARESRSPPRSRPKQWPLTEPLHSSRSARSRMRSQTSATSPSACRSKRLRSRKVPTRCASPRSSTARAAATCSGCQI